jgi:hypothetical protein
MRIEQRQWTADAGWVPPAPAGAGTRPDMLLVFGSNGCLDRARFEDLKRAYPDALIVGCSTSGEIQGTRVFDDTLVATAIGFEHTRVRLARELIPVGGDSYAAGVSLAQQLPAESLSHVFVLSDGLRVNGTALVDGLTHVLPQGVTVTGGLSGDGARFQRTLVVADAAPAEGAIAAVGFYGSRLRVGHGSLGGWDQFGADRLITRSEGNVLFELDGQSALALYKRYLGKHAADLPASGLLFPLALRGESDDEQGLVRTILSVDEATQSMTFAGDMPEGRYARLMKANFDRLIEGASGAARGTRHGLRDSRPELAILISCVGRRLVLSQRVEEELDGVRDVLGLDVPLTGFYSYGEISPYAPTGRCELHNQTMTITTFSES